MKAKTVTREKLTKLRDNLRRKASRKAEREFFAKVKPPKKGRER